MFPVSLNIQSAVRHSRGENPIREVWERKKADLLPGEIIQNNISRSRSLKQESRFPYGLHFAGGGDSVGNIGGIAEKMVFLSSPVWTVDRETRAATRPAFPTRVGSV